MYTRAFSTLGCPALSLEETLALAQRRGVGGVELRALGGTLDLPAYLGERFANPGELAGLARAASVKIVALGTSLKLAGSTEHERAAFLRFVPWAEALGARLRVFDGEADLAAAAETLAWWRAQRAARGGRVELMIETHDSLLTSERLGVFLEAFPDVGLLWDAHHTWKKGGEDPLETWKVIGPHVVHVHVKDSRPVASEALPYTYVLPGTGEFPMRRLQSVLAREFGGVVSLEWEKLWHPALPPLEAALVAAKTHEWW